MFEFCAEHPLVSDKTIKLSAMAYDGCFYFFSSKTEPTITVFDECFRHFKSIRTCRSYSNICYDSIDCCFWATSIQQNAIYKLNNKFVEVDKIVLTDLRVPVVGISHCTNTNQLFIATTNSICCISKQNTSKYVEFIKLKNGVCSGVTCIAPYTIYSMIQNTKQFINICDGDGKDVVSFCAVENCSINSIAFLPIKDKAKLLFSFFAIKHNEYPFIFDVSLDKKLLCNFCECNYVDKPQKQECCAEKTNCEPAHIEQNIRLNYNGFEDLKFFCEHELNFSCSPDYNCDCCTPCRCELSICKIFESVAYVEAAIAHILNAEGEKLQKVIASTKDVCLLLEANKSVNNMIISATHLEQVLYNKLSILNDCQFDECFFDQCNCNNCAPCNNSAPCNKCKNK